MAIKQFHGSYELPEGESEQEEAAKKNGVEIESFATANEFYSSKITVAGKVYTRIDGYSNNNKDEIRKNSTKIHGLRCPDCEAQAFKTDQKNVAVCGDYPGWYFFYRRTDLDKTSSSKIRIKIVNGKAVYVDDSGTEVNKLE